MQRCIARSFEEMYTGIPAAERTADFRLKLVPRLRRVPPRCPREGQQLGRTVVAADAAVALHREREWRVGVLRRARLVHEHDGARCSTTGLAVRRTREAHPPDPEGRVRRGVDDSFEL